MNTQPELFPEPEDTNRWDSLGNYFEGELLAIMGISLGNVEAPNGWGAHENQQLGLGLWGGWTSC